MANTLNHAIRGIVIKDNVVYVPLDEIIKFCKKFPTIKADQLSEVIDQSVKTLLADAEVLKQVPRVVVDSSINK